MDQVVIEFKARLDYVDILNTSNLVFNLLQKRGFYSLDVNVLILKILILKLLKTIYISKDHW
jgi:hypothetical protein